MQPRVLILRAPGTNCDGETAHAFSLAGGRPEIVHVRRVAESPRLLAESQILCIPGGFSYGDDIASGRIFGGQLQHHLADAMQEFKAAGKLILGICNGFQVLIKCGLLANDAQHGPAATLAWNTSGRFEDRWVRLMVEGSGFRSPQATRRGEVQVSAGDSLGPGSGVTTVSPPRAEANGPPAAKDDDIQINPSQCVFLTGIEQMYLPVAHGEGRFVARDETTLNQLRDRGQLSLRYTPLSLSANDKGVASLDQPLPYPDNPNGAQLNVAGMCDATGRIFGLMPHPERHVDRTQHPRWTRGEGGEVGDGLRLFQNAVRFFQ